MRTADRSYGWRGAGPEHSLLRRLGRWALLAARHRVTIRREGARRPCVYPSEGVMWRTVFGVLVVVAHGLLTIVIWTPTREP